MSMCQCPRKCLGSLQLVTSMRTVTNRDSTERVKATKASVCVSKAWQSIRKDLVCVSERVIRSDLMLFHSKNHKTGVHRSDCSRHNWNGCEPNTKPTQLMMVQAFSILICSPTPRVPNGAAKEISQILNDSMCTTWGRGEDGETIQLINKKSSFCQQKLWLCFQGIARIPTEPRWTDSHHTHANSLVPRMWTNALIRSDLVLMVF